jgi:hypothetical protein
MEGTCIDAFEFSLLVSAPAKLTEQMRTSTLRHAM